MLDREFGFVPTTAGVVPAGRLGRQTHVWNGYEWARVLRVQYGPTQPGVMVVTKRGNVVRTEGFQQVMLASGARSVEQLVRGDPFRAKPMPLEGREDQDGVVAVALAGVLACRVPQARVYRGRPYLSDTLVRVRQSWERVSGVTAGFRLGHKLDVVVLKVKPESGAAVVSALGLDRIKAPVAELVGRLCRQAVAMFLTHLIALAGEISGYWLRWKVRGERDAIALQQLLWSFGVPAERRAVSEVSCELRVAWHSAGYLEDLFRFDPWLHYWISSWRRHGRYDYRYDPWLDERPSEWTDSVSRLEPCLLKPVYLEVAGGSVVCNGVTLVASEVSDGRGQ